MTTDQQRHLYCEIGKRVRAQRLKAGITQAQLARLTGMSRVSITNLETGKQRIPLHVLYAVAYTVGADPVELLPDVRIEEDALDLLDLTDEEKAAIRRAVEEILRSES